MLGFIMSKIKWDAKRHFYGDLATFTEKLYNFESYI